MSYDLEALKALYEKAESGLWEFSPRHIEEGEAAVRSDVGSIICTASCDANAELTAALHNAFQQLAAALDRAQRVEEAATQAMIACEAFTDPEDRMPEDTGEFRDLSAALIALRAALAQSDEKESKDGR